ncbi:MAG TPA: DinB family protein [Pyrinomonadaceae bacterium]|nr:DinB family protein [Pyrinomonadaceae bacterium]
MSRIKWTDRRFSFDFPTGIYPEMIERIRGTPARLEDLFAGLPPEKLIAQVEGRWSMQENAGHLLDLESLVSQRIDEYLARNSELHAADMSNRRTYDANHNNVAADSILKAFRAARHDIVGRLESFDAAIFERSALHPRLNVPMRLVDMLFFQAEHDDYHLARISELKKNLVRKT